MTNEPLSEVHFQVRRRLAVVIVGMLTALGLGVYLWLEFGAVLALTAGAGLIIGFMLGIMFTVLWRLED